MFGRATIRLGIGPHSSYVTELQLHRLRMELIGEMHSTDKDETQSEIEHYFNMRVPSESMSREESLQILSKIAKVYLGTTLSSVPDECMFSTTEIISNRKTSALDLRN